MLGPLLIIVIGVLFLLNNMFPGMFRFGKMWPVIIIVVGLAKVFEYLQGHPEPPLQPPLQPEPPLQREEKKEGQ